MKSLFIQLSDNVYIQIDPYDWFCGPGSHIHNIYIWYDTYSYLYIIAVISHCSSSVLLDYFYNALFALNIIFCIETIIYLFYLLYNHSIFCYVLALTGLPSASSDAFII